MSALARTAPTTMPPHYLALDILLAAAGVVATIAAVQVPTSADMVAVLGAMLATVIAVLDARKKDRSLGNTVAVVIGSAFVGSVAPGACFYTAFPDLAAKFTWHMWATLGFVGGLTGWSAVLAAISIWRSRQDKVLNNLANRFIGPDAANVTNSPAPTGAPINPNQTP